MHGKSVFKMHQVRAFACPWGGGICAEGNYARRQYNKQLVDSTLL